jgi:hypothetical protein
VASFKKWKLSPYLKLEQIFSNQTLIGFNEEALPGKAYDSIAIRGFLDVRENENNTFSVTRLTAPTYSNYPAPIFVFNNCTIGKVPAQEAWNNNLDSFYTGSVNQ